MGRSAHRGSSHLYRAMAHGQWLPGVWSFASALGTLDQRGVGMLKRWKPNSSRILSALGLRGDVLTRYRFAAPMGFTLIELMITVAVVAILATIALPSYNNYVREGRRSDAYSALSNIALQQEKYRANNTKYGTRTQLGGSAESPDRHYEILIDESTVTAIGYVAQAKAKAGGSQASDRQGGQPCSTLTLTVTNGAPAYTPESCWKK